MRTVRLTAGNDRYTTRDDDFEVFALGGDDTITVDRFFTHPDGGGLLFVHGGAGNDRLLGGDSDEVKVLYGEGGNDYIEIGSGVEVGNAYGGDGNDVLRSTLAEGGGNQLFGGRGDDTLYGSDRANETDLTGGTGKDTLVGGDEFDLFRFFDGHTVAGSNRDVIRNFDRNEDEPGDSISLFGIDADKDVAGNQAFDFVGRTRNPGTGELGYYRSGADTIVVGDDGRVTFEIELDNFAAKLDEGHFAL